MSIEDFANKIKPLAGPEARRRIFPVLALFLAASAAFALGRLSVPRQKPPITVGHFDALPGAVVPAVTGDIQGGEGSQAGKAPAKPSDPAKSSSDKADPNAPGAVFASKSGTKYYPKGCKGGNRVAAANRIWFKSAAEAQKLGMALASGCKL